MKKIYSKPSMTVVKIQHQGIICTSDPVRSVQTTGFDDDEDNFIWGGGGSQQGR